MEDDDCVSSEVGCSSAENETLLSVIEGVMMPYDLSAMEYFGANPFPLLLLLLLFFFMGFFFFFFAYNAVVVVVVVNVDVDVEVDAINDDDGDT